jgi:hypothetical protein
MDILSQPDPRINEIIALAQEEGLPLALHPITICALEDCGYLADPFTGMIWPDPARRQTARPDMIIMLTNADLKAQAMTA